MIGMLKRTFLSGVLLSSSLLRQDSGARASETEGSQETFRFVGEKKRFEVRGRNPRYYTSLAPYHWQIAGVKIARDGIRNPAVDKYLDKACFSEVTEAARRIALEQATSDSEMRLRVSPWFLDAKVGMLPSFRYAQMLPGGDAGGRAAALLDARKMFTVANVVSELSRSGRHLDFCVGMLAWIARYQASVSPTQVAHLQRLGNNHWSWFLAQQIAIASLLGQEKRYDELVIRAQAALAAQSGPDGQPLKEMARGNSLSHAVFNARAWSAVVIQVAADRGGGYAAANLAKALPLISFSLEGAQRPERWAWRQNSRLSPESVSALSEIYEIISPAVRMRKTIPHRKTLLVAGLV